ncbi:MAG: Calx-beta domain-containing protein [Bacillota bacterium]
MTRKQKRRDRFISLFVLCVFAAVFVFPMPLFATPGDPLTVKDMNSITPEQLVEAMVGSGVAVSNIQFAGDETAAGTFSGDPEILGLGSGIVLGTGDINKSVPGPNNNSGVSEEFYLPGDADLDQIVYPFNTEDATVLEFDFVPQTDRLTFQYVFASDEYNEYVGSEYNDVFAFFLNGVNVALIPGTNDRICINNINNGNPDGDPPIPHHPEYFRNNESIDGESPINTEMNGLTTVLTIDRAVNKGVTNHIKLAIADTSDNALDSNVFISNFTSAPPPQFQFSDDGYTVDENAGTATITVNRTGNPDIPAGVDYATSDGTASGGSDYTTAAGTLEFAAGETSKTFTVPILDDNLNEGDETVNLTLGNTSEGASIGTPGTAVLTINDDDAPPSIHFSQENYTVNESDGSAFITVTRTGSTESVVSVVYSTSDGTATAGTDYASVSGTVYLNSGEAGRTFEIPIINDNGAEGNETVNLTLSDSNGILLGSPDKSILTIIDDDTPSTIQFSDPLYTVGENSGPAIITVNRTGNSGSVASVTYTTSDGTAKDGFDYNSVTGTVYFENGETNKTLTIPIIDDNTYEGNETVNLSLSDISGAILGEQATAVLTIQENDPHHNGGGGSSGGGSDTFKFSSASYTVNEDGGSATITVKRTGSATGAAGVQYAGSNGTATAGSDYTAASGKLEFASGETSKSFTIPVLDDSIIEGNETVNLTLSNPTGATIGSPGKAVLTIIDNDTTPPAAEGIEPTDSAGHWAHDCIIALLEEGVINGYPDFTIRPDYSITRAEAAVLVVNALKLGDYQPINSTGPYRDALPEWAKKAILTATEKGIMAGYTDGAFRPDQFITRAEMCTVLIKAFPGNRVEGFQMDFTDNADIPAWSYQFVEKAAGNRIVTGYPDRTFRPNSNITRAESFTIICKLTGLHDRHTGPTTKTTSRRGN